MAQYEVRDVVAAFATYEDYLDSQVDSLDKAFVEDVETRRALVELGLRGSGETLKRAEFEARKQADRERNLHKELAAKTLASADADVSERPLLAALAAREELVRSGKLNTILFLRTVNKAGQEVSGYIDFAHRLQLDTWEPVFRGAAKIEPRPSDLSYYNWATGVSTINASPNFAVSADGGTAGLLFKAKRDRKTIQVDPAKPSGDGNTRTEVEGSEGYLQAVIFDHFMKKG